MTARAIFLAVALLAAGAAGAQTMTGPVTDDPDLAQGQDSVPADRDLAPPGTPQAAGTLPMDITTPITALPPGSDYVPRPGPGSNGASETARLDALPEVQTVPAWTSDNTGDGMEMIGLEPPSYARGELVAMGAGLVQNAGNACIACHGPRGAGDGSGAIPRIAGLPAWYIAHQLHSYAAGTRDNEVMQQVVGTLTRQNQLDLAVYYSAIEAPLAPASPGPDPDLLQHGARIASQGLAERLIPACETCHAMDLAGQPPEVPYLAGQYGAYVSAQLRAWQRGGRRNDEGGMMRSIAAKMTERDIEALGLYIGSLR